MSPNDADRMANSVDPDLTAQSDLVCSDLCLKTWDHFNYGSHTCVAQFLFCIQSGFHKVTRKSNFSQISILCSCFGLISVLRPFNTF